MWTLVSMDHAVCARLDKAFAFNSLPRPACGYNTCCRGFDARDKEADKSHVAVDFTLVVANISFKVAPLVISEIRELNSLWPTRLFR